MNSDVWRRRLHNAIDALLPGTDSAHLPYRAAKMNTFMEYLELYIESKVTEALQKKGLR